jgi:hypothetical protein
MNFIWLQTFYIVGAIVLLAIAIVAYLSLPEKINKLV